MKRPTLSYSVIIPSYNRCETLPRAIDSVLRQNYKPLEIIVIDDGSDDNTAQMLSARYPASVYPQITCYAQTNSGPATARNHGIERARGEVIAFLDSDDVWLPGKLRAEQKLFATLPNAEMLAGNARVLLNGQPHIADAYRKWSIFFAKQQARAFDWSLPIMAQGPACYTSTMSIKAPALRRLGHRPFDERLRYNEDWDLQFRLFDRCSAWLFPQIVCQRHIDDDGTRHFYHYTGHGKTPQQQKQLDQQKQNIIKRYLDSARSWSNETRERYWQRYTELQKLTQETLE